jgi:predicted nucleotidyltransferase
MGIGHHRPVIAAAAGSALADAVRSEPAVLAACLFGSIARGTAGPMSDVDVGLLLSPGSDGEAACGRVHDALCRELRRDDVDVIALAGAPAPLRYRAVRDGQLIVCRDRAAYERLVTRAVLEYLDIKPARDRACARVRDSVAREE